MQGKGKATAIRKEESTNKKVISNRRKWKYNGRNQKEHIL